ncbi:hypothetical protein C7H81_05615 [Bacillus subtilis]|nr:hypothetical protein CVV77_03085 [Bacillus sp. SN1]PSI06444.1 hypothetical protein C7H81_05615 [Bacillus subtilis]
MKLSDFPIGKSLFSCLASEACSIKDFTCGRHQFVIVKAAGQILEKSGKMTNDVRLTEIELHFETDIHMIKKHLHEYDKCSLYSLKNY